MKNELRSLSQREVLNTLDIKGRSGYECQQVQLTTIQFILYGVTGVAVAREIVALQGTDHPRDFPPNIGDQLSWLERHSDKVEVLGPIPRSPTTRIPFTASKWSRDRKSHHKGCVKPYLPLYAVVAQRQSTCLLSKGSRYRNSLAAPNAGGNRKFVGENVNPHRPSEAVAEVSGSKSTLKCPQLWSCNYVILVLTTHNQKKCSNFAMLEQCLTYPVGRASVPIAVRVTPTRVGQWGGKVKRITSVTMVSLTKSKHICG